MASLKATYLLTYLSCCLDQNSSSLWMS